MTDASLTINFVEGGGGAPGTAPSAPIRPTEEFGKVRPATPSQVVFGDSETGGGATTEVENRQRPGAPGKPPKLEKTKSEEVADSFMGGLNLPTITKAAVAAGAAVAPVALATAAVREISSRTNRLSQFSPAITSVQSQNEAAKLLQDVRAAESLGQGLANIEAAKGGFSRALQAAKDSATGAVGSAFSGLLRALGSRSPAEEAADADSLGRSAVAGLLDTYMLGFLVTDRLGKERSTTSSIEVLKIDHLEPEEFTGGRIIATDTDPTRAAPGLNLDLR